MPLIDLKTNLKSLKYGNDRLGNGSSREPFITEPIPEGDTPGASTDFILRQGAIRNSGKDASRLTKLLFSTTRGLLFTPNNNLLSRTSVKTEATLGPAYAGGVINQGVYLPTSTIAQSLAGFSGTHLNLLGLDPSSPMSGVVEGGLFPGGGLIRYEQVVRDLNNQEGDSSNNRLVSLYDTKISGLTPTPKNSLVASSDLNILSYSGGPGSVLGIGKTIIKRATNTTGINEYGFTVKDFLTGSFNKVSEAKTYFNENNPSGSIDVVTFGAGSTAKSSSLALPQAITSSLNYAKSKISEAKTTFNTNYSSPPKITDSFTDPTGVNILPGISSGTYNATVNFPRGVVSNNEIVTLNTAYKKPDKSDLKYTTPGETREFTANPNFKRNIYKLSEYNKSQPDRGTQYSYAVDKFNATTTQTLNVSGLGEDLPIGEVENNQLFKFYLNFIDPNNPSSNNYIYWQAYVNSFDDNISSTYDPYNYVGRGYPLYKYGGFSRKISLDFTIVATNPTQIIPIYTKLNKLIQFMAPNYSNGGYLRGNFVKLTFGDYLNSVPGFINGFALNPIFEAGFDITKGKQLPKAIKVSGFGFTPIADNDNKLISSNSNFISAVNPSQPTTS